MLKKQCVEDISDFKKFEILKKHALGPFCGNDPYVSLQYER